MTLQKLLIKGFQKHTNTKIKLGPYITTITGATDIGKSSVIRALYWLAMNKPGGIDFISWGEKTASVSIQANDKRITRLKGKSTNKYKIKDGKDVQVFEAFKSEIPPDITKNLNMNELNFQWQFDAPYWLSCSAGEVSRQLNQIIDLGVIDDTLAKLSSGVRRAKAEIEVSKARHEECQTKVRNLKYVDEMKEEFEAIERIQKKYNLANKNSEFLKGSVNKIIAQEAIIDQSEGITNDGKRIIQLGEKWSQAKITVSKIQKSITNIENLERITKQKIPDLSTLEKIEKKYQTATKQVKNLQKAIKIIEEKEKEKWQKEKSLATVKEIFHQQVGGTCPLCGNVMES